jgi:hypothetical protein
MLFYFTIWSTVAGTVGLVMAFARTGPDEARSKLAEWADYFGLKRLAAKLAKYSLDVKVIRYGNWAIAVLLFVGGMLFHAWLISSPELKANRFSIQFSRHYDEVAHYQDQHYTLVRFRLVPIKGEVSNVHIEAVSFQLLKDGKWSDPLDSEPLRLPAVDNGTTVFKISRLI